MNRDQVASSGVRKAAIIHESSPSGDVRGTPVMLLRLGRHWFAIDVLAIVKVVLKGAVTRVPSAPSHILGIASLGGRLVTVLSLGQMIGGAGLLSHEHATTLPRLVVLRHGEYEMAVVAEGIYGMTEHVGGGETELETTGALPEFVRGEFLWDGHRVGLLDVPRLVATAVKLSGIDSPSDLAEA
jgi:chemotaxis signal transduction protein